MVKTEGGGADPASEHPGGVRLRLKRKEQTVGSQESMIEEGERKRVGGGVEREKKGEEPGGR